MNNINESKTEYIVARRNGVLGSAVKDKNGKIIGWKSEKERPIPNANKSAFFKNEKPSLRPEIQRFKPETKAQIDARVAALNSKSKPTPQAPQDPQASKPAPEAPQAPKPASQTPQAPKPASQAPQASKPASTPAKTSSSSASTAEKIRGGSEVYNRQIKMGDIKGAEKTGMDVWRAKYANTLAKNVTPSGTQKGTGQSVMAKQSAELRALRPAPQAPGNEKPGYSGPPTPSAPQAQSNLAGGSYSSGATKLMSQRTKNVLGVKESYDAFDLVLEYLFSQGHVGTLDEALYVMMEMDSECIRSIAENVEKGPILPGEKGKRVYPKGQEPKPTGAKLPPV